MISLAYILMRKTIDIFLPDYLPTLKWIAYIEFVQTQNQYTVYPVNNQTNLKSVWTMMLFFFFAVRGPLTVPTTSTPSLACKITRLLGILLTNLFFFFSVLRIWSFNFLSPSQNCWHFYLSNIVLCATISILLQNEVKSGGEWRHTGQRSPRYVQKSNSE